MTELLLGLRLLLGSGRGNRVRFFLMSVGSAVGVCCLAVVLAIPGVLAAQDARVAQRQPTCDIDAQAHCINGDGAPLELTRTDPLGARPMTRVFLAPGTRRIEPPPGLREFPEAGEVFLSPRLHAALQNHPQLAQLLPGREKGFVGAEGLARPDELFAYVGVGRDQLREGGPITRFGMSYPPDPTVESSTLDIVRFTLAGVVLLPLAVFLSVCARLSAAARSRRLAALRLLGLSKKGVQRVNAAETVAAALLGAVLGLCAYWILNQLISRVGLPGFTWYPSDGTLTLPTSLVCLIGCPALAWFVGRASARKAAANPLAVRRSAVEKPPGKWGLLPLVPGLGIVAGYCVAGATGHAPHETGLSAVLMPIAVVLVGAGLVLALPLLSRLLARRVARSSSSLPLGIAMRRNEVEPGGALRVATGLVLLVYAASLVQGVLIELDQVSKHNSPVQIYNVMLDGLPTEQQLGLEEVPGLRAHAVEMRSTDAVGGDDGSPISALVATCSQLRALLPKVDHCVDNRVVRLREEGDYEGLGEPGSPHAFEVQKHGDKRVVQVRVPEEIIRYRDWPEIGALDAELLVPPSFLPAGYLPVSGELTLLSDSDPATVRNVLDSVGSVDPTIDVQPFGINVTALQQIGIVKTLLAVGMVLGLIIGVAAYLVASADRAVERRSQVTALALLGARPRTLRAVQVAQVVVPLAVGLVLAVVAGKAAESSYLVTGGGDIFWDGDGVPLLIGCAIGAVGVAALGSLPLIGRRIDPELIRRD
ncbi:ABC transporter permease [Streptomyces sp. Ru71]|uniref:FtsX-like permease family protein n=1 Tax=Streptomyces sp. Ru71 TaxID=2080746 RepID=UPI000CDE042F|nr:FtsX-like permease family protein [Streptomyces sp. Ru71]POX48620.1 ABC transporter permease [Streptomyces sp. Ru71]